MRALKTIAFVAATAMLAGSALAQTQPPQTPPAQTPPVQTPPQKPPVQPPAQPPKAPQPFPEGAKIAYVDIQTIASNSAEGKAASAKLEELRKKKTAELGEKQKALQAAQTKLQQGGTVLSDQARGQLEKDIDKMQRELQFAQQDAQAEVQQLTDELQGDFQRKLNPVIDQIANEKGLHFVFSIRDAGAIWANTGLDLSAEVIKRFDAAAKTTDKK